MNRANFACASSAAGAVALVLLITPFAVAAIPVAIGAIVLGTMGLKSEMRVWGIVGIVCGGTAIVLTVASVGIFLFELRAYNLELLGSDRR